jgi:hypothetical protein
MEDDMTEKEKQPEKQLLTVEELVNSIAEDIVRLSEDVAGAKVARDIKNLSVSPAIPEARTIALKGIIGKLREEGQKASRQQEEQVRLRSEALQQSIKTRQANLKLSLDKLQKAGTNADTRDASKIVDLRVSENIKSYDQSIEELNIQKRESPGSIWAEADMSEQITKTATARATDPSTESNISKNIQPTNSNK